MTFSIKVSGKFLFNFHAGKISLNFASLSAVTKEREQDCSFVRNNMKRTASRGSAALASLKKITNGTGQRLRFLILCDRQMDGSMQHWFMHVDTGKRTNPICSVGLMWPRSIGGPIYMPELLLAYS